MAMLFASNLEKPTIIIFYRVGKRVDSSNGAGFFCGVRNIYFIGLRNLTVTFLCNEWNGQILGDTKQTVAEGDRTVEVTAIPT